jgi:hypothetical protein
MDQKNYIMPASLREALVGYLSSRPYAEVQEGMAALLSLKEATAEVIEE